MEPLVKTTKNLIEQGISPNGIKRAVQKQELIKLRKGVYIDTARWNSLYPSERYGAQIQALAQQQSYVFTHDSAAFILGLPLLRIPEKVHLYAETSSRTAIHGAQKHYYREAPEIMEYQGLRITSPMRTLVDCAKTLPLPGALCVADSALHRGIVDFHTARSALLMAQGRGVRQCRRIAELMSPKSESPGETLTRLELINHDIPFEEQYWIQTPDGRYRADFAVKGHMVLIEFDGDIKHQHDPQQTILNERKRERVLQNLGWLVVRVEWRHLKESGRVAALVRQAMRLR